MDKIGLIESGPYHAELVTNCTKHNYYRAQIGGCFKAIIILNSNADIISEIPFNGSHITSYDIDIIKMIIMKHENIRERVKFQGVPEFLKTTNETIEVEAEQLEFIA